MKIGPSSITLCLCLGLSSLAFAQGTSCGADGDSSAQGSPIACVTGDGAQVTAATPAPAQEILPLSPEQRPAAAPVVTYIDGKLTVVAKNSTLGDILRAIAAKTGASIDIPEAASERVVSQLGPAPTREVLTSLLNGSHYNYVMVGNETNPNSVAHVILTAKSERPEGSTPGAVTAASNGGRAMVQPRTALQAAIMQPYQEMLQQQQAQQAAATELQQQIVEAETSSQTGGDSNVATASASSNTGASASAGETPTPEAPTPEAPRSNNAASEKTPQQVLQDMYETRRQMMQQQHQPAPQQAPPQQ